MPADDYARSGVDTDEADRALARLLLELSPTQAYGPRMEVGVGHFAAVIRVGPLQLALTTDGVGTKLLIAELAERYESVGIDCVAMNVNDLICVGAEPVAMLDYIAVERADPEVFAQIGRSLAEGARQAGVSIVGGETAQVRDMLKGAVEGRGLDLVGMAIGVVPDGGLIDGSTIQPGDALLGIESSGLHSNGYSLARAALLQKLKLDEYVEELGCSLVDALLEPVHIYVRQAKALAEASVRVRAMAHITGDGLLNLRRVEAPVGFELTSLPEPPPIFQLIERLGEVSRGEMRTVFNMGIGFAVVVAEADADKALELIRGTGLDAWQIGFAVADPERRVRLVEERLVGTSKHFTPE
ncbi:MAG: phosphoribosylformylglycinamidine cyclo-ligase [Deltaproteobacteria bacterium]|nr:phosphoribosylformylglycinamidine cyclo-ligase [Deltaproteobacteria bacterium]MBW2415391.1 phosphoribosylformylglycinamidine cyclo-ligase [Deltaproteobacteria bacterium]